MRMLFIANDPAYGTKRVHDAVLLVHALTKQDTAPDVVVFLMAEPDKELAF